MKKEEYEKLFKEKKYIELEKRCKEELEINPKDKDALFYLAMVYFASGKDPKYLDIYGERLYRITKNPGYLMLRAIYFYYIKDIKKAEGFLDKMMKEDKKVGSALVSFLISSKFGDAEEIKKSLMVSILRDKEKAINFITEYISEMDMKKELKVSLVQLLYIIADILKGESR